jgi:hypothetical protein
MPRHPTGHDGNVRLWFIPAVILQWIKKVGEDLEWVRMRRTTHHYYLVSIRTRSVKREFRRPAAARITGPLARANAGVV